MRNMSAKFNRSYWPVLKGGIVIAAICFIGSKGYLDYDDSWLVLLLGFGIGLLVSTK